MGVWQGDGRRDGGVHRAQSVLADDAGRREESVALWCAGGGGFVEHSPPGGGKRVWLADPAEAQYLQTTPAHVVEIAARLVAAQGLLRIEGEWAEPTQGLLGQAARFENTRREAVEELEKKHAFERG